MVEVTIVCLIYKSKQLAKAVYDSLYESTPKLKNGEADLLFVANDPTAELVDYLNKQDYPFMVNVNECLTDQELFERGCGAPEYMRRVYQGYNQGILNAKGKKIVLINSDNFFSTDWLENLLKYSDYKKIVTSTLIEPGQCEHGVFPGAIQKDFGKVLETYKDTDFQEFAAKTSKTGYTSGGAYMPCLLYKDIAIMAGLYPEGNIAGKTFDDIKRYGDESFYDKLNDFGVEHITAKDSIVYHLKEGEKSESVDGEKIIDDAKYIRAGLSEIHKVHPNNLMCYIKPESGHQEIMDALGQKISVIILRFNDNSDLDYQIQQIQKQTNKNFEITALYDETNKDMIDCKQKNIEYIFVDSSKKDVELCSLIHRIYGEYLLVPDKKCDYVDTLFEQKYQKDKINYIGNNLQKQGMIHDSIGNFIVPKSILLDNIGVFLGLFFSPGDVDIESSKCALLSHIIVESEPVVTDNIDMHSHLKAVIKDSLPYRAARKLYYEGPRGAAKAVLNKINRQE